MKVISHDAFCSSYCHGIRLTCEMRKRQVLGLCCHGGGWCVTRSLILGSLTPWSQVSKRADDWLLPTGEPCPG